VCQKAAGILAQCANSQDAPLLTGACTGDARTAAEAIVAGGCAALSNSQADSFGCPLKFRLLGMCIDPHLVKAQVALPMIGDICPVEPTDDLCNALRDGAAGTDAETAYAKARDAVRARIAAEPRESVLTDPAIRFYVRERVQSLLVWNVVTKLGQNADK